MRFSILSHYRHYNVRLTWLIVYLQVYINNCEKGISYNNQKNRLFENIYIIYIYISQVRVVERQIDDDNKSRQQKRKDTQNKYDESATKTTTIG